MMRFLRALPARHIWRFVWLPVVIAFGAVGLLHLLGRGTEFWQLWLLVLAILAVIYLVRSLRGTARVSAPEPARSRSPYIQDRPFAEVNRWEERLSWGSVDVDRFQRTVQRRLVEVIAERLRLRHGVELASEPHRARAILDEYTYSLVAHPVATPIDKSEMDNIVRRIEEI